MGTMKLIPFAVTADDFWVSLPLQGLTPALLMLAVKQRTGYQLYPSAYEPIMATIAREWTKPCKYCGQRKVSRLFIIMTPKDNHRLRAFIVCKSCANQMRLDVTDGI